MNASQWWKSSYRIMGNYGMKIFMKYNTTTRHMYIESMRLSPRTAILYDDQWNTEQYPTLIAIDCVGCWDWGFVGLFQHMNLKTLNLSFVLNFVTWDEGDQRRFDICHNFHIISLWSQILVTSTPTLLSRCLPLVCWTCAGPLPWLGVSLTIKGCVHVCVCHVLSPHHWIKYLNTPSQGSDTELNI